MSDLIVTVDDCRKAGFCANKGIKPFFENDYPELGVSFREFVRNGIKADKLAALKDARADRVIALAKERVSLNNSH